MDTSQVSDFIHKITLKHMTLEIDPTRFLREDYPEAHIDLAIFLVQQYYVQIMAVTDVHAKDRQQNSLDKAKWFAAKRLTQDLHALVDRSTTFILDEAERTRWFSSKIFNYDTLTQLLASMYDMEDPKHIGSSTWYDWRTVIQTMLPLARRFNIDTGELMASSMQVKKLRAACPIFTHLQEKLDAGVITPEVAAELMTEVIHEVADPRVSGAMIDRKSDEIRGKVIKSPEALSGFIYITPDGGEWLVIPTDGDPVKRRTVQLGLNNRVNFEMKSLSELLSAVAEMIKSERLKELQANENAIEVSLPDERRVFVRDPA